MKVSEAVERLRAHVTWATANKVSVRFDADLQALLNSHEALRLAAETAWTLLEDLLPHVETPPEPNCRCHLSPPCGDCVDWSHLRETLASVDKARALSRAHHEASE